MTNLDTILSDECPHCGEKHVWDAQRDYYLDAREEIVLDKPETTFYRCECGAVFAIGVLDDFGFVMYTPSKGGL